MLPLFSFLEDGSRPARDPVYLSRPINIGPSPCEKSRPSLSLCVRGVPLRDAASARRRLTVKMLERVHGTRGRENKSASPSTVRDLIPDVSVFETSIGIICLVDDARR